MLLGCLLSLLLVSCGNPRQALRVGTNIWIGYESLYVAEHQGYLGDGTVRLVTMRNASEVQQAMHAGLLDAAALSLDEALNLVDEGLDLKIVLVTDVSNGADVVLGRPDIDSLQDLRGKRIGVETTALGAVMLQACLEAAGLGPEDLQIIDTGIDRHASAFRKGQVDAVVTFEPVRSQLLREGAHLLFDSSMAPERIVDVLVVTGEALERDPQSVRTLIAGHFRAIEYFRSQPLLAAGIMQPRQRLPAGDIVKAFDGVRIPDIAGNHRLLGHMSGGPALEANAAKLARLMLEHKLLQGALDVKGLADDRFLPAP
jgi:NitT/TauT family transport system substrate-binding protein